MLHCTRLGANVVVAIDIDHGASSCGASAWLRRGAGRATAAPRLRKRRKAARRGARRVRHALSEELVLALPVEPKSSAGTDLLWSEEDIGNVFEVAVVFSTPQPECARRARVRWFHRPRAERFPQLPLGCSSVDSCIGREVLVWARPAERWPSWARRRPPPAP